MGFVINLNDLSIIYLAFISLFIILFGLKKAVGLFNV